NAFDLSPSSCETENVTPSQNEELLRACHESVSLQEDRVYETNSGIVYTNIFCAICNE
ncbi:hypothetical protein BgiMline_006395, partial [Biomphalaria glabrata]